MNSLIGWGVVVLLVVAMVLYCAWTNRKKKKQEKKEEEERRMEEEERHREEWDKTVKRWKEIHALSKEWEAEADHEVIGFSKWAQERGVNPYELEHIYFEYMHVLAK